MIHAGTGGFGQAAINLAICYGLEIFTTVGTPSKREYIKQNYPCINGELLIPRSLQQKPSTKVYMYVK